MSAWMGIRVVIGIGVVLMVTAFGFCVAAIWADTGGRLGSTAAIFLVAGFLTFWGGRIATIGGPERPAARLPRDERRRIAQERARIAADAQIARLEKEAGL